jgi:hypothetical protein
VSTDPDRLHRTALAAGRLVDAVHRGTRPDVVRALAACRESAGGDPDVLAITLAAMVDPAADLADLLRWCSADPSELPPRRQARRLPREHGTPRGYWQHRDNGERTCAECRAAHAVENRPQVCRDEFARLCAAGVGVIEAANRSRLRDVLAAHRERAAAAGLPTIARTA